MPDKTAPDCTAFRGQQRFVTGSLAEVALAIKPISEDPSAEPVLVFDDRTGRSIDLDTRGSEEDVLERYTPKARPRGRGRPRLGVIAREVTLLPRHWEWLAAQPGSASVTLRKLVEQARRAEDGTTQRRAAQERAYHFMSAMAGDLPGFEEAVRALFASDLPRLQQLVATWPRDVREHALHLADLRDSASASADD